MVQASRPTSPPPNERYQTIIARLDAIVQRLETLERAVDRMDRGQRPYGDGTLLRRDRE